MFIGAIKGIKKVPAVDDSPTRVKKEIHELLANRHILRYVRPTFLLSLVCFEKCLSYFSQEQSRRGFSRYLRFVQQRLPGLENSTDGEHQLDLIERFLQRLGSAGRLRSASPAHTVRISMIDNYHRNSKNLLF